MGVSARRLMVALVLVIAPLARADNGVLKVGAESHIGVLPDRAVMRFTITRRGAAMVDAVDRCAAAYDSVTVALKTAGMNAAAMSTGRFSAGPHFIRIPRDGALTQDGFEASQDVRLTLDEPSKVSRAIYAIANVGDIPFGSLTWSTSQGPELADQALAAAVRKARAKAAVMAEAAGVPLGSMIELAADRNIPEPVPDSMSLSPSPITIKPDSVFVRCSVMGTWKLVEEADEQ